MAANFVFNVVRRYTSLKLVALAKDIKRSQIARHSGIASELAGS
jgi:hypothetical protein